MSKKAHDIVQCVRCGVAMDNVLENGFQPMNGLAFSTRGHYGSDFFDPMDGSRIEICVCDDCLRVVSKSGSMWHYPARSDLPS